MRVYLELLLVRTGDDGLRVDVANLLERDPVRAAETVRWLQREDRDDDRFEIVSAPSLVTLADQGAYMMVDEAPGPRSVDHRRRLTIGVSPVDDGTFGLRLVLDETDPPAAEVHVDWTSRLGLADPWVARRLGPDLLLIVSTAVVR